MLGWEQIQNLVNALFEQHDSTGNFIPSLEETSNSLQSEQTKLSSTLQGQFETDWSLHAEETCFSAFANHHPRTVSLRR